MALDIGERVATDGGEPVAAIGEAVGPVGEIERPAAGDDLTGESIVTLPGDVVVHAGLAGGEGDVDDLDVGKERLVAAAIAGGHRAGQREAVSRAVGADAEGVRDVDVAARRGTAGQRGVLGRRGRRCGGDEQKEE